MFLRIVPDERSAFFLREMAMFRAGLAAAIAVGVCAPAQAAVTVVDIAVHSAIPGLVFEFQPVSLEAGDVLLMRVNLAQPLGLSAGNRFEIFSTIGARPGEADGNLDVSVFDQDGREVALSGTPEVFKNFNSFRFPRKARQDFFVARVDLEYEAFEPVILRSATLAVLVPLATPEPASWAMMIAGFGVLGAAARRRVHAVVRQGSKV